MKTFIVFLLFLFLQSAILISQNQVIVLEKKNSEKVDILKEHQRIKIVTANGKEFYGRFSIVDENTIEINNSTIPLDSIIKIKRKSLTSLILSPIVPLIGVVFILGGTAVAVTGATGAIVGSGMVASGFTMTLASLISNKHNKEEWNYKIVSNPTN